VRVCIVCIMHFDSHRSPNCVSGGNADSPKGVRDEIARVEPYQCMGAGDPNQSFLHFYFFFYCSEVAFLLILSSLLWAGCLGKYLFHRPLPHNHHSSDSTDMFHSVPWGSSVCVHRHAIVLVVYAVAICILAQYMQACFSECGS